MHQNVFRGQAPPGPAGERSPRPPSWVRGEGWREWEGAKEGGDPRKGEDPQCLKCADTKEMNNASCLGIKRSKFMVTVE